MTGNGMVFFQANFMLQSPHHHHEDLHHEHHNPPTSLNPLLPSGSPHQDFHGVASFLGKRAMSFSGIELGTEEGHVEDAYDLSDDESQAGGEKKRRLNMEQVKTLEKNFELGNKLEPERKMQLARALGLQPRQIAIWFQNRRARWKTKQLEKDYDILKRQFDSIKADNESLQAHNQKLQSEIQALKNREPSESINLNIKETEGSCSTIRNENNFAEIKLDISRTPSDIDSPPLSSSHQNPIITSRPFFPLSTSSTRPSGLQQLFHPTPSSRPEQQLLQCSQKNIDHIVKEESLSNMLCGMDDQSGFWPWLEQHQFN